jgi:isoamylase
MSDERQAVMRLFRTFAVILLASAGFAITADASIDPNSLGASYNSQGTEITFRVYSANATNIVLYLYTAGYGVQESATYTLSQEGSGVWQVVVPVSEIQQAGITGTVYYGYRAWGPNWTYSSSWTKGSNTGFVSDVDSNGNRFNPNKLLLDPYAREISQDPLNANNQDADIFATGSAVDSNFGVAYRDIDSGTYAPKGIVLAASTQSTGTKPTRAQKDDVIYEVNVRGLTKQDPNTPSQYQGTYYGAGLKASYLASLGVTVVEFLPMQETQNDENDVIPDSTEDQNYWGYMTEDFFAPDRRYASNKNPGGPTQEFQEMVEMFHNAGIKVYMDVVYNHTAEGGTWTGSDPTTATVYSWRGLDNATYYELTTGNQYFYDDTGTGGNFNTYNPAARQMIIDSLAYWSGTMGIDGFRFDEAPVLGNNCLNQSYESGAPNCPNGGFNFDPSDANVAIDQILDNFTVRPVSGGSGLDLYAEPWTASGGDDQGQFPVGWSEWNGAFEATLRQAQNELGNMPISIGQDATDFTGSSNIFQANGRSPWNSTNYMDVHDGFTLNDVYYCDSPNNSQGWPYGPSTGGSTTNYSWNQGGAAADQRRAARTGLAFTMLSAGTPLMAGGDEYLRSIDCNNNPYNVDSTANWLDYSWSTNQSNFYNFAQRAIAFRKAHPALRPVTWYTSSQVEWWEPSGVQATTSYWDAGDNYAIAYTVNGSSFGDSNSMYIAYNGWSESVTFTLPAPPTGTNWYRVTDTCNWNDGPNTWVTPGNETEIGPGGSTYGQCGESLLLLISK